MGKFVYQRFSLDDLRKGERHCSMKTPRPIRTKKNGIVDYAV